MNPPKGGSDEPLEKNGGEVPEKKRFHQFLGSMFRGGETLTTCITQEVAQLSTKTGNTHNVECSQCP